MVWINNKWYKIIIKNLNNDERKAQDLEDEIFEKILDDDERAKWERNEI